MADAVERQTEESQTEGNPEAEGKAREIGWVAKDEFRGDPAKWVDAETYLDRGEQFIPFLKADRQKLKGEVDTLRGKLASLENTLAASTETIEELKKFNTETALAKVKEQKRDLRSRLITARKEGDTETELEIQDQLDAVDEAITTSEETPKVKPNGSGNEQLDLTKRPEFQQFIRDNPWFVDNSRARALSLAIMQEMTGAGELEGMTPQQRFSKVAAETKKSLGMEDGVRRQSKVESSHGSGDEGSGGHRGKTYGDLPAEAKTICDRQAPKFVGQGRAFKDAKAWREHYAQKYFE